MCSRVGRKLTAPGQTIAHALGTGLSPHTRYLLTARTRPKYGVQLSELYIQAHTARAVLMRAH